MNTKELIEYIENGKLDTKFIELYGENKLERQRNRYISALNGFLTTYGDNSDNSNNKYSDDIRIFSVPGRSEISGNHTDHNNGKVIAASIDLDIIAVVSASNDNCIRLKSEGFEEETVSLDKLVPEKDLFFTSAALIAGVCDGFVKNGYKIGGFNAYTTNDVFKGSGLSSSAAFEVMIGNILRTLYKNDISNLEIAKISQYSENVFFGKPCGLMDQTACAVGGFIAIDFENPKSPIVTKPSFDLSSMGYSLCIVNTGGNHADLNDDYASIPLEMKSVAAFFGKSVLREVKKSQIISNITTLREKCGDRAILRALHYLSENDRVEIQTKALQNGDINGFFSGVRASGNSSFKYLQNVYTTKNISEQGLSLALNLAEEFLSEISKPSACRVHGGGFAGTIQAFVPEENASDFEKLMNCIFGEGACHILKIRQEGAICIV